VQLNNTTDKNGLIQDCEVLLNFPDAGISSDATLLAQFKGLLNVAYKKVAMYALLASRQWQWDDSNYSDFPRGVGNLVNGQRDYQMPVAFTSADASTLWRLLGVSVLDTSGNEVKLQHTDVDEATLRRTYTTAGTPIYYHAIGNNIKMYPAPATGNVTLTNGLIVYFERTPDTLSDNTDVPGLPDVFHRMISLEACMDYAGSRGLPNAAYMQNKLVELKAQLDETMAERDHGAGVRLYPRIETYR
jgi:hypothetical protein